MEDFSYVICKDMTDRRNKFFLFGCTQVMILSQDKDRGRISLSTKKLEPTPGDMLRNPQLVYEKVSYFHLAIISCDLSIVVLYSTYGF
jgi:hypothetical protein